MRKLEYLVDRVIESTMLAVAGIIWIIFLMTAVGAAVVLGKLMP